MLHHVTGKHEWVLGGNVGTPNCDHGVLPPCEQYLQAGSPPHIALTKIAMDERLMKNIPYFVNFRYVKVGAL